MSTHQAMSAEEIRARARVEWDEMMTPAYRAEMLGTAALLRERGVEGFARACQDPQGRAGVADTLRSLAGFIENVFRLHDAELAARSA